MSESAVFGREVAGEGTLPGFMYAPVETIDGPVPVHQLLDRLYNGPHGQHMRGQPLRFDKFSYDRERKLADQGMDVDPIGHQWEAALYGTYLLEDEMLVHGKLPDGLDESDAGLIIFILGVHDMGEDTHPDILATVGATVGDIPFGQKTDDDRATETAVRNYHWAKTFPDIPPELVERIETVITHRDKTILGDLYEAAHDLQAYATGLRAREAQQRILAAPSLGHMDQLIANINGELHNEVSEAMAGAVVRWADRFVFGQTFVTFHDLSLRALRSQQESKPAA